MEASELHFSLRHVQHYFYWLLYRFFHSILQDYLVDLQYVHLLIAMNFANYFDLTDY